MKFVRCAVLSESITKCFNRSRRVTRRKIPYEENRNTVRRNAISITRFTPQLGRRRVYNATTVEILGVLSRRRFVNRIPVLNGGRNRYVQSLNESREERKQNRNRARRREYI